MTEAGSEGVILRDPTSFYESGYSSGYYKHKVIHYMVIL